MGAQNPNWTRDELILALDLYFRLGRGTPGKSHPEVVKLSGLLNSLPIHGGTDRRADFRNPAGVAMKLGNFASVDPAYDGEGLKRGSAGGRSVWAEFADDPTRLASVAAAIRTGANSEEGRTPSEENGENEFAEGRVVYRMHRRRERSQRLVAEKKRRVLARGGSLACQACGFDFAARYGDLGEGYIECHHVKPVSELRPGEKTRLSDLALVCANCHRMLHRRRPWLGMGELAQVLSG